MKDRSLNSVNSLESIGYSIKKIFEMYLKKYSLESIKQPELEKDFVWYYKVLITPTLNIYRK